MKKILSIDNLIDLFKEKSYLLEMGAGKLAKRYNTTPDVIKAIKETVRKETVNTTNINNMSKYKATKNIEDLNYRVEVEESDNKKIEVYKTNEKIVTLEDFVNYFKPDLSIWNIKRWRQNYWAGFTQVRVEYERKTKEEEVKEDFLEFLTTYKPHNNPILKSKNISDNPNGLLIFNKQDAHLNKYDIGGDNDIHDRFSKIDEKFYKIIRKAANNTNLEKIVYVIGSDAFNSEFTGTTTKGTPQLNIGNYQETFEQICQHEVNCIDLFLNYSEEVNVVYVSGNHDEYVGWNMVKWLEAYYRKDTRVKFDTSPSYRKYVKYSNTAMLFNHGDALKAEKLASLFPVEYKQEWSSCDNFYIFTGDKHHTLSKDLNGIEYFQLPAFSYTKSNWDDKNGHVGSKSKAVAFVIEENEGISDIIPSQF
jgi:lipoprotein-anchoring transpeptidase ErfK/SrfK